jgi:hypothetical protein
MPLTALANIVTYFVSKKARIEVVGWERRHAECDIEEQTPRFGIFAQ